MQHLQNKPSLNPALPKVQDWLDEYFYGDVNTHKEFLELGQTIPFSNTEFVALFMEKWVDYFDNLYEQKRLFGDVLELSSITALRGFKREELRLIFSNKTLPENYKYYRVFDYFTINKNDACISNLPEDNC